MKKKAQLLAAVCLAGTLAGMAPADVSAQSLWAAEEGVGTSLFADRKASKVGDILTIIINETTSTSASKTNKNGKSGKQNLNSFIWNLILI